MRFDEYLSQVKNISRSQAQDLIKRGKVRLGTKFITKPAWRVAGGERVQIIEKDLFVSRAGSKLASVAPYFKLDFNNKTVLDIGSSTGGFTEFALKKGAKKVIAVDVGSNQMHPRLAALPEVDLREKTDIRDVVLDKNELPDIVVADVSFISLTKILPKLTSNLKQGSQLLVMAKPQFESEGFKLNDGVVKNSKQRRQILDRFEDWLRLNGWLVKAKRDSGLAGAKGNLERFYLLTKV